MVVVGRVLILNRWCIRYFRRSLNLLTRAPVGEGQRNAPGASPSHPRLRSSQRNVGGLTASGDRHSGRRAPRRGMFRWRTVLEPAACGPGTPPRLAPGRKRSSQRDRSDRRTRHQAEAFLAEEQRPVRTEEGRAERAKEGRPSFARSLVPHLIGLSRDLEAYLRLYNEERAHTGWLPQGTPI